MRQIVHHTRTSFYRPQDAPQRTIYAPMLRYFPHQERSTESHTKPPQGAEKPRHGSPAAGQEESPGDHPRSFQPVFSSSAKLISADCAGAGFFVPFVHRAQLVPVSVPTLAIPELHAVLLEPFAKVGEVFFARILNCRRSIFLISISQNHCKPFLSGLMPCLIWFECTLLRSVCQP